MYARDYPASKSGTVRAFEDAYAKEDFLRRSAENASFSCSSPATPHKNEKALCARDADAAPKACADVNSSSCADVGEKKPSETAKSCPLQRLGLSDGGDWLLLLLILFFLTDADSENDKLVPLILAVLLFL